MPRHTIHEVAVNAKLTIMKLDGPDKECNETAMSLIADLGDEEIIEYAIECLLNQQHDRALFVAAVLAERQNNQRRKKELEELNK